MIQNEKIVALNPERGSTPVARTEQSFWAVWKSGSEWPTMFVTKAAAEADARSKARLNPGETVWLMKVDPRGTIKYPHGPIVTGDLSEAPPEPRAVPEARAMPEPRSVPDTRAVPEARVLPRAPRPVETVVHKEPAPVREPLAPREPIAQREPVAAVRERLAPRAPVAAQRDPSPIKESALGLWWPDNRG